LEHNNEIFAFLSDDDISLELEKYLNETFVHLRKDK
jgi:hypothetical protein